MKNNDVSQAPKIKREVFGKLANGSVVEIVTMRGDNGFEVRLITYGAAIQSIFAADRNGKIADVVLGRHTLAGYVDDRRFLGATVGRFANRIAGGKFTLDGHEYELTLGANDGGANAIHGGPQGFDRKNWKIEEIGENPNPFVTMSYVSADGEEKYPGQLTTRLTYRVSGSELSAVFTSVTDKPTVLNLTNHSFFNLAGVEGRANILDHRITIPADRYLPVNDVGIPLESIQSVEGTAFDCRKPRRVGDDIHSADQQIKLRQGYDHCYCLPGDLTKEARLAARVEDPASGRIMEVFTNQPGIQFYSGNFMNGAVIGKYGRAHNQYDALCLEPQVYPNSPNRPDFPSSRLDPGQTYSHKILYRFSAS